MVDQVAGLEGLAEVNISQHSHQLLLEQEVPMNRLLAVTTLVLFTAACSDTAHITQPESAQSPAPAFDRGGVPNDASGLDPSVAGAYQVSVTVTATLIPGDTGPVGTEFANCYTFQENGVWIDPGFPVAGTWTEETRGATSRYAAIAEVDGLLLEQTGKMTPWPGQDSRKLTAHSIFSVGGTVLAEFASRGSGVDSCAP